MASQRIPWQNLEIRSPICLLRELGDQCCKSNSKQDDCILESACCRVVLVLSCPKPSFTFRFPILVQFQWLQKVSVLFVGPLGSALQRVVCRLLNMTRASARVDQRGNQKGWFFGVIAAFPEHQQEFLAKNSVDYSVASYSPTACQIGQCFPKSGFPSLGSFPRIQYHSLNQARLFFSAQLIHHPSVARAPSTKTPSLTDTTS